MSSFVAKYFLLHIYCFSFYFFELFSFKKAEIRDCLCFMFVKFDIFIIPIPDVKTIIFNINLLNKYSYAIVCIYFIFACKKFKMFSFPSIIPTLEINSYNFGSNVFKKGCSAIINASKKSLNDVQWDLTRLFIEKKKID